MGRYPLSDGQFRKVARNGSKNFTVPTIFYSY